MTPHKDLATAVPADFRLPAWPDRSHRTVAEVWSLTPEQVAVEQKQSGIGGGDERL